MPTTVTNSVVAIATFVLGSICLWNPERCLGLHPFIKRTVRASRASKEGRERLKNIFPEETWWLEDYDYRYRLLPEEVGSLPWGKRALWKYLSSQYAADGQYLREMIAHHLVKGVLQPNPSQPDGDSNDGALRVLDLGCGVGMSTRAIAATFQQDDASTNGVTIIGVDNSPYKLDICMELLENRGIQTTNDSKGQFLGQFFRTKTYWNSFDSMIKQVLDNRHQAKHNDTGRRNNNKAINKDHSKKNAASTVKAVTDVDTTFVHANAEQTPFSRDSFDLVTMVYVLHQAPLESRDRILREAHRVLKPGGILAVVDISPEYEPSDAMIAEEPYLKEYQSNYRTQFHRFPLGGSFSQDRMHVAPVILSVFVKPESKSLVKGRRRPPGWRNRWIRLNDSRKEKSNLKENGWQIIGRTLPRPNERQYRNTDRNKRDKWVYVDE